MLDVVMDLQSYQGDNRFQQPKTIRLLGYLLGGHFLDTFVDVDKADAMADFELHGEGRLTTSDPRWCGAWWIGFALAMIIALVLG